MTRRLVVLLAAVGLGACAHRAEPRVTERRALRLLAAAAERETTRITTLAEHLEADTDQERTPHVVATGETPLLSAEGAVLTLAGDEAGTQGFSVDNAILLEVFSSDGQRLNRAAVGYLNGLAEGKEQIDLLSRRVFRFEANEVNLASLVPEHGVFRIKATVLDIGGVGSVSDVFVIVTPRSATRDDDLRGQ